MKIFIVYIPLHFIIGEVDRFIEKSNENKCLVFTYTDKSRKVLKKYTELLD